jgi:hypothetical protein
MARKLKTYQTSLGFFDLAIAAPSMKAALEAWGADSNLFHRARRRKVTIRTSSPRPTDLGGSGPTTAARKSKGSKAKQPSSRPIDKAAERKAALAFEKEQKRRERERASEEAARQKDRERRQQEVDKAQAALNKAEQEHAKRAATIQAEVEALEKRSQAEETRWDKEKGRLEAALRRARG